MAPYLKISSVLLQMFLYTGAELQDPAPLCLHGCLVCLQEMRNMRIYKVGIVSSP